MPPFNPIPRFVPGQLSYKAQDFNNIISQLEKVIQESQNQRDFPYLQLMAKCKGDIISGDFGDVVRIWHDVGSSTFIEQGDTFQAINIGPGDALTDDRVIIGRGSVAGGPNPFFFPFGER